MNVTQERYKTLHAPYKKLVWFNDSAHLVYEEEPGKVLVTLVNDVLPLTRGKQIARRSAATGRAEVLCRAYWRPGL